MAFFKESERLSSVLIAQLVCQHFFTLSVMCIRAHSFTSCNEEEL